MFTLTIHSFLRSGRYGGRRHYVFPTYEQAALCYHLVRTVPGNGPSFAAISEGTL